MANDNNGSFVMDVQHHDSNPANTQPRVIVPQDLNAIAQQSPSRVDYDNAPGGAVVAIPSPRGPKENKNSPVESKAGKYNDRIRMAPFTGRRFQEEQTKLSRT